MAKNNVIQSAQSSIQAALEDLASSEIMAIMRDIRKEELAIASAQQRVTDMKNHITVIQEKLQKDIDSYAKMA